MSHRNRSSLVFVALLALSTAPALAQDFIFHLRGDQEVPPVPSPASGGCMGVLDQGAATFDLTCVHNVTEATLIHVHRGAAGVNGPVAFDLGAPTSPVTASWTGMTATDIAELLAGDLYINVHSAGRPAGEIRGQILVRTIDNVAFTADGSQNVPPTASTATASCTADLDGPATALAVQCTHDVATPLAAHVHVAPFGQNGPLVFTFPSAASPISGNVPMTTQRVAEFAAAFLYLDIHRPPSEIDPEGDIRGQIGQPPLAATTGTIHIRKVTIPAGGTGFGFTDDVPGSPGTFTLDDGQSEDFLAVTPGTYTVTEDDPGVAPGGYALTDVSCDDADSVGNPFARTATVVLAAGEVVTCTFENFEVSPGDQLFVFHLNGSQEVPPVPTISTGGCMGRFDAGAGTLALICTHNVAGPTVMHIHRAPAGGNGPIFFDLGDPTSPVQAVWTGMTPADIADLLAGNLYVNIHTAGRPGGEIRGQILERTVDTVAFTADGSQNVPATASTATASCTADLDAPATALAVQCTHNVATPLAAHVHDAPRGQNGPIVFTFASAASPLAGNVPMNPRLVADFAATFLYLDIHTPVVEDSPEGDIRGQIGEPPPITTGAIRITKATFPAGGAGFGFTDDVPGSPGAFTLADGQTQEFLGVPPGTYVVTEDDPAPGHALTDVECFDTDSEGNPFARTATVRLQAGEVVSCTFRNLAVAAPSQIFVFHLDGAQEVPPVPSAARGGCMGMFDGGASSLALVCTHNVIGATVMHIHRGAAGVNGPIVFDLGDPQSPVEAVWTGMTPADIADLQAGNLYVNIHTSGRPGGEIRGQILPRTVDSFSFLANSAQQVPPVSSPAIGQCFADLGDDATTLLVRCTHDVSAPTASHLHDAPPGENGPVVFEFPGASPFSGDVPMSPRLVADFAAGFLYVNVHSLEFPDGEIRGQLIAGALAVTDIPTLGGWGLILLALSLAPLAWWRLSAGR